MPANLPDDELDADELDEDELAEERYDRLCDTLQAVIASNGALVASELAAKLTECAPALVEELDAKDLSAFVHHVSVDADGFWPLPDGRIGFQASTMARSVFTHRLTADELARDALDLVPDLTSGVGVEDLRLADGTIVYDRDLRSDRRASTSGSLLGPVGWLSAYRPGDLLAVRIADTIVGIEVVAEDSIDQERSTLVTGYLQELMALRAQHAAPASRFSRPPETFELVFDVIVVHPDAFAEPVLPLEELLPAAGLELRDEWIGVAGSGWLTPADEGRERRLNEALRDPNFDPCCRSALQGAYTSWRAHAKDGLAITRDQVEEIAAQLDHGPTAPLLDDFAARGYDDEVGTLGAWSEALSGVLHPEVSAGVEFLRACMADRDGDGKRASAHADRALEQDPGHTGALLLAADLAQESEDSKTAWAYCMRAGLHPEDLSELARYIPDRNAVGRNEPCPCGSGRKFKACCQRSGLALAMPVRFRWLLDRAERFVGRTMQIEMRDCYLSGHSGQDAKLVVFDELLFHRGGLDRYLATRGPLLADDMLAETALWPNEPLRLLEVSAKDPGRSFSVVDLRSGERFEVYHEIGGESAVIGASVLARVVPAGEMRLLPGMVIRIELGARPRVLDMLDRDVTHDDVIELLESLSASAALAE